MENFTKAELLNVMVAIDPNDIKSLMAESYKKGVKAGMTSAILGGLCIFLLYKFNNGGTKK